MLAAALLLALAARDAAAGQTTGSSPGAAGGDVTRATLADVRFIAGVGTGAWNGGTIEEHWSLPHGDAMMGMFSYQKDGRARFYEFLLIEQTDAGLVLRLKHFNPGLIGWEEKAEVHSYPLTAIAPRRAIFERPDKQTRLTFDATKGDTLSVTLDQLRDGKTSSSVFVYRHAAAAPAAGR